MRNKDRTAYFQPEFREDLHLRVQTRPPCGPERPGTGRSPHAVLFRRIIPTSVGNGDVNKNTTVWKTVHPHERGERYLGQDFGRSGDGSSPRAWGTARPRDPGRAPAGSSPRAWGTVRGMRDALDAARFIPTSVGNGSLDCSVLCIMTVHPHERGERNASSRLPVSLRGSSPRAWGTGSGAEYLADMVRFIPTSVGNGTGGTIFALIQPVHPHERGERHVVTPGGRVSSGSSPRAWGTVNSSCPSGTTCRFIPTSVGNG